MKRILLFLVTYLAILPTLACAASIDARLTAIEARMAAMQMNYEQQIASLTEQLNALKLVAATSSADDTDELASLKADAATELSTIETISSPPKDDSERKFIAGDLSRQAENPELSVVGDFVYRLQSIDKVRNNSDAMMRNLGVHYETYLDPYTKFKGAVPVKEDISNLGEAYITRFGVTRNLNFTIGKFRQQFGVVHRWHQAGLDQVDFPLAMRRVLGDGGIVQNGIALDWQLGGSGKTTHELTMQLTEATNTRLFAGNTRGMPAMLLHFKAFKDVNTDTYHELGLTTMAGVNDQWSIKNGATTDTRDLNRPVFAFGLDFTHLWEPADNMRYRNFLWRTEFYGVRKDILTPDTGDKESIFAWGGYTNLQWKLDRQLTSGFRFDYYEPDSQKYASVPSLSLYPLAVIAQSPSEWQLCPYLTWEQSPWVKYRLEFNYKSGNNMGPDERRVMLQCIWSAGPHKHDRY